MSETINFENIGKNDEETIENKEVIKIEEKKVEEEKVEKEDENKLDEKIPENLNKIKETKSSKEIEDDKDTMVHIVEIDSSSNAQKPEKLNEKEKKNPHEIKLGEIKQEEKNLQEIKLEETGNKTVDLFIQKIQYYQKIYNFTQTYVTNLVNIIKRFYESLYKKICNSYSNDIKPLIKYIGRLSYVYTALNLEMKKINFDVEQTMGQQHDSYLLGDDSSKIAHKTNILLDENFKNISTEIKKKIVSNPNYSKMDSVPTKLDFIYRKGLAMVSELEQKKKEYEIIYIKNYEKEFNSFLKQFKAPDIINILQDFTDYSIVEFYFINASNQIFSNCNHYLNEIYVIVKNLKEILLEYIDLLKQAMEVYHNHISKIFNMNLYKTFGDYEKFVENISKKSINLKLSVKKLLESKQDQINLKEFNDLLFEYKENLLNNPNPNNDLIKDDNNFLVEKYNSIEKFFNFLIQLIPKTIEINNNVLIQYQKNCKRSAGMFKGFKNAYIVVTIQGHILILDDEKDKNENIISNKIFMIYNKSKVQIRKKESKKTNFLLSIWEITNNKKKIKHLILDTLNEENLNETIKHIGGLIEGVETERSEGEEQEEKNNKKEIGDE